MHSMWAMILTGVLIASLACSGSTPASSEVDVAPTSVSSEPTSISIGSKSTVTVAEDPELGTILVDGDGLTLYLFTQDGPNTPTCTGGCAQTWPPLRASLVHLNLAGEGVNPDLFATVALADDTSQVTYNGHPLYNYSGDRNPGDTFGDKVGGTWFVVSQNGEPVTGSEAAPIPLEDAY